MPRLSKRKIAEALHATEGRVYLAAQRLGCSARAIYNWLEKDHTLAALLEESRQKMVELAESKLVEKIKQGNLRAIIFALKTLGKQRGYTERMEFQHSDSSEVRLAGLDPESLRLKAERLLQWNAPHKSNGSPSG